MHDCRRMFKNLLTIAENITCNFAKTGRDKEDKVKVKHLLFRSPGLKCDLRWALCARVHYRRFTTTFIATHAKIYRNSMLTQLEMYTYMNEQV